MSQSLIILVLPFLPLFEIPSGSGSGHQNIDPVRDCAFCVFDVPFIMHDR